MRTWLGIAAAVVVLVVLFVALRAFEAGDDASPSRGAASTESSATGGAAPLDAAGAELARTSAVDAPRTASATAAAADRRHDLFGRVVDERDEPVPGARLEAFLDEVGPGALGEASTRTSIARTESDELGRFALRVPRGLPCELDVGKDGYAPARFVLRAAGEELVVRLTAPARLVVRLAREDGGPVGDVAVAVEPVREGSDASWSSLAESRTDALGIARFDALPAGPVMVEVAPVDTVVPRPARVELKAGEVVERVVALAPGATVRGRVLDARSKSPIAGARLGIGPGLHGRTVTTDAQGEYAWPGVPADRAFLLHVEARGYGHASKTVKGGPTEPASERVDFELVPARRARGRLLASDATTPVPNARVEARNVRGRLDTYDVRAARTDAEGRFELVDLRADVTHELWVLARGHGRVLVPFPATEAQSAVVELGDVVLAASATASGRVLDGAGKPVAGAMLFARVLELPSAAPGTSGSTASGEPRGSSAGNAPLESSGSAAGAAPRDPRGSSVGNAPPESSGSAAGAAPRNPRGSAAGGALEGPSSTVTAPAPGGAPSAGSSAGSTSDTSTTPAPRSGLGARSAAWRARTRELPFRTDDLGRFCITDLPAGRLVIEADVAGARERPKLEVEVKAGEERADLVLVVDLGLVIAGRVLDPTGAPMPMVNLSLRMADGTRMGHAPLRTGSDGTFLAPALPAGRYQVLAWPENREGSEAAGTLYANRIVDDVEAGTKALEIVLVAGKYARGVVLDREGQPMASIYVNAKNARGSQLAAILTDTQGRFQLLLDPDQEHELEARPPTSPGDRAALDQAPDPSAYARKKGVRGGAQDVELRFP
ncbi:MAG: carboxypeptidase regulatory-like domain-containing protein [Planctomycetes bacterium]|nr:carboxypeptidase regulatory-like domain-containing protein [Planctomycetota bacterium]